MARSGGRVYDRVAPVAADSGAGHQIDLYGFGPLFDIGIAVRDRRSREKQDVRSLVHTSGRKTIRPRTRRSTMKAILSAVFSAVLSFIFLATPARAQVPTVRVPGSNAVIVELVEYHALDVSPLATVNLFTVPVGRRLVITDFVISNDGPTVPQPAWVLRNESRVVSVDIPAGGTVDHTFATGIQFDAGDILSVHNPASSGANEQFLLTGYLVPLPVVGRP